MQTNIIVNTQFTALHSWDTCNIPEVMYLKNLHRHVFHVTVKFKVNHDDRDLEFFCVKKDLNTFLKYNFEGKELLGVSCEMLAIKILDYAKLISPGACYVRVMEDNECGAEVIDE